MLISRCEDYLEFNQPEPVQYPRDLERTTLLVFCGHRLMKVHDAEPDDNYIVSQKMVNTYLSEAWHSKPLLYWKEKQA